MKPLEMGGEMQDNNGARTVLATPSRPSAHDADGGRDAMPDPDRNPDTRSAHCWHETEPPHLTPSSLHIGYARCCHCGVRGERVYAPEAAHGHGPHAPRVLVAEPLVYGEVSGYSGRRSYPIPDACPVPEEDA